jgi:hypothetical protein
MRIVIGVTAAFALAGCYGAPPPADVNATYGALEASEIGAEPVSAAEADQSPSIQASSDVTVLKVETAGARRFQESVLDVDISGRSNWITDDGTPNALEHGGLLLTLSNSTAAPARYDVFLAKFVCDTRVDPLQGAMANQVVLPPMTQHTYNWDCSNATFHASNVIANVAIYRD